MSEQAPNEAEKAEERPAMPPHSSAPVVPPLRSAPPSASLPPLPPPPDMNIPTKPPPRRYLVQTDPFRPPWPIYLKGTNHAKRLAHQNHLTLADLLQGMGLPTKGTIPTPFRSLGKSWNLFWHQVPLEFVESLDEPEIDLPSEAALQESDGNLEYELQILEDQVDSLLTESSSPSQALALTSSLDLPWMKRFRRALDQKRVAGSFVRCPIVCLHVQTTRDSTHEPSETQLPAPFPIAVPTQTLLLHDAADGPCDNPQAIVVNTIPSGTAVQLAKEENSDAWGGGGQCGQRLGVSDRAALRKFLAEWVSTGVLPALERRLMELNQIVSDRKKGVKNVFKSLWRTSEAEYTVESIESQTRWLADTLFLLQDHDSAYNTYRLIKDDYRQDKAHLQYANVQEMMALCLYSLDPFGRAREIFSSVESALLSYSRAEEVLLATRLCLILVSMTQLSRPLEVADLLASASSNETSLGAAVLLEQASAHYYQAEMYRKYSFHMLMAGHMFRSANQDHHAFRCFTSALHIYRDSKWDELHNHLLSALAAQLFAMGRMSTALQLYAKLVGTGGRVSVKSQQKFVDHLLEICDEHPKKALAGADRMMSTSKVEGVDRDRVRKERMDRIVQVVRYTRSASRVLELPNMDLPIINDDSIAVVNDESSQMQVKGRTSFGEVHQGDEDMWQQLELAAIAEVRAVDPTAPKLDEAVTKTLARIEDPDTRRVIAQIDKEKANRTMRERAKRSAAHAESPQVRAVQEPFSVKFEATNPLGIPVNLASMQLVARMESDGGVCTNEDAVSITPLKSYDQKETWKFHSSRHSFEAADFCRLSDSSSSSEEKQSWKASEDTRPFFVVTKSDISLEPEETVTLSATICPLVPGSIEIIGVRYRLLDKVWAYHPFAVKGRLLQNTRENRANRVRAESILLKARIEEGMPCLSAELICPSSSSEVEADSVLLEGQVRRWKLHLTNVGTASATNVFLKTNAPWLNIPSGIVAESAENAEKDATACCVGPTGTLMKLPLRAPDLPKQGEIPPGASVDIPVDIRISRTGKQDFYFLLRYDLVEGESTATEDSRSRWLRKMYKLVVYPSVSIAVSVTPSFRHTSEHIVSVDIVNLRSDRPDKPDIIIDSIALASRCYKLVPIHGLLSDTHSPVNSRLAWQESMALHFRLVPDDQTKQPVTISQCKLSNMVDDSVVTLDASSSDMLDFLCLEKSHDHFHDVWNSHNKALLRAIAAQDDDSQPRSIAQIRRANTSMGVDYVDSASSITPPAHPTSIYRHCSIEDALRSMHVVCSWRCGDGVMHGAHHRSDVAVRQKGPDNGCPIALAASHPHEFSNSFSKGPASVPIDLTLRNKLLDSNVEFVLTVDCPETFDLGGPEALFRELKGGDELALRLNAIIPSPGVYNLQRVRLTVGGKEPISYLFPHQWVVHVKEHTI